MAGAAVRTERRATVGATTTILIIVVTRLMIVVARDECVRGNFTPNYRTSFTHAIPCLPSAPGFASHREKRKDMHRGPGSDEP